MQDDDEPLFLKTDVTRKDVAEDVYRPPAAPIEYDFLREELPLATLGSRFVGRFVDNLAYGACWIPLAIGVVALDGRDLDGVIIALGLMSALLSLGLLAYNLHLNVTTGQSIGKRVAGTRMVHFTGRKAGTHELVLLRFFVVNTIVYVLACLGLNAIWSIIDVVPIFGKERRMVHDHIAGTSVVEAYFNPYED